MAEALRGDLAHVRLSSVLLLAEAEALSGRLLLAEGAYVDLANGEPVGAAVGQLTGFPALRTLFFIQSGPFTLDLQAAPAGKVLAPVTHSVLDGLRLVDEWTRIGPLVLARQGAVQAREASADQVVRRLDGKTPLQDLVYGQGCSPALIVDPLLELIETGQLYETGPPAALRAWPGPSALASATTNESNTSDTQEGPGFDALMDEGRRHMREGRMDDAEEAFQRALLLSPDDRIATQNLRRLRHLRDQGAPSPLNSWARMTTSSNSR